MVSQQQFRLKWNNHRNTVLQEFGNLLNKNFFVDCIVGAEGKYLNAHKIVLSACSPYFQNIFSEHFDKHPVILLKDVLFSELKCLLDYMYNGEVNISECDLPSFLRTAQSLKIKGLAEDISDYDSASDSEPAPVGSYAENGRAVEANVEIHDDDGPPAAKKSSAPYLLSSAAKSANDSIAGRKRKSPSSPVPSHGKSNSQARVSVVSSAAAAAPAKPSEVSNNAVTDADASSQCSAAREEAASDDGGDSSRKASSLSDHREPSKRTEVKEEPVDNEVDLDDNSSYECGNNAGEENDALNEDSESNCANSGNKFNELSIASVSSFSENDANGRSPREATVDEQRRAKENEELGKGRRKKFRNSKYEGDFGVPSSDDEAELKDVGVAGSASDHELGGSPSKVAGGRRSRSKLQKTLSRSLGNLAAVGTPKKAADRRANRSASAKGSRRQPKFECDGCSRVYRWKEGLASHKRLYCGKEPRFKCPHCDKRSFQKINLDTHIATYHVNATA